MTKVLLLGTSRLHRPFAKRVERRIVENIRKEVEVVFAKMGYFHTAAEILQVIRFMKDPDSVPLALRPYVFRVEPRPTTPLNEFDIEFESAIREGLPCHPKVSVDNIDCLMMEVSSLSVNLHASENTFLHANPNILRNVAYKDIYPDGYYAKFEPGMPVEKSDTSQESLTSQLREIRAEIPHARVVVMGHLRSDGQPNTVRDRIHHYLLSACAQSGCTYFDNAPFLDRFGFAVNDGVVDPHHLSLDGEEAIGQAMQATISGG